MTPYRPGLGAHDYGTRQDAEQFVREALGEWAAEYDVPALTDALHEHAGRSWDMARVPEDRFWRVVRQHERPVAEVLATDHELRARMHAEGQGAPLLDSTDAAAAEVRWVASEARALMSDDDPQRRASFLERKRALLAYIAQTTGAGQ